MFTAMDACQKIEQYRLLDAHYGQLTTSMRLRDEHVKLRREQVRLRGQSVQNRVVAVLLTLVAGVPALFAVIPESSGFRGWWPWVFGLLAVLYLAVLCRQWRGQKSEEAALNELLPESPDQAIEDQPAFMLMEISACGTRLSLARSVLEDLPGEPTKSKFQAAVEHHAAVLTSYAGRARKLHEKGQLSGERFATISRWIELARM